MDRDRSGIFGRFDRDATLERGFSALAVIAFGQRGFNNGFIYISAIVE